MDGPDPYVSPPQPLIDAALLLPYPDNRDTLFGLYEAANYPDGPYGYLLEAQVARISTKVTKQTDIVDHVGQPRGTRVLLAGAGAPVTTLSPAAVTADVATLVADGATPTQAHVTTLNTDWTALLAQINAVTPESGDVYVSFDTSKITTRRQLKTALDAVLTQAVGSGSVTP